MSHQLKLIMGLITLLALLAAPAQATMVVDTGYGASHFAFDSTWYYAGKFHTDQEYTITRVQGYLNWGSGATTLTAAIFNGTEAGTTPGTLKFSETFSASGTAGWQGPATLSWDLPAGDYWVSIVVPSGSTFAGSYYIPPAGQGLANNALHTGVVWVVSSQKSAFLVEGTPVPLPPTIWLLGAGLLGLGGLRFRRR